MVGSCGVGGMHVVFVASAAQVFLVGHPVRSSCVEGASEVWLLNWFVNGSYVFSNT